MSIHINPNTIQVEQIGEGGDELAESLQREPRIQLRHNTEARVLLGVFLYEFAWSVSVIPFMTRNAGWTSPESYFAVWSLFFCVALHGRWMAHVLIFLQRNRRISYRWTVSPYQLQKYTDLFYVACSFAGHVLVIHYYNMRLTNPNVYYYSLVLLLHNYIHLILYSLAYFTLILCRPCILRWLHPYLDRRNGMSEKEINRLPRRRFGQGDGGGQEGSVDSNLECSVCLEDFEKDEVLITLACGHHYHERCLVPWIRINRTCPMCREVIGERNRVENTPMPELP